jgi:methyl-accepting chemotaxis protein
MSLNDLSVSKKLTSSFAALVVILLVMCVTVALSLMSFRSAGSANDESKAELNAETAALMSQVERLAAVRGYVASGDESFVQKIKDQDLAFETALQTLSTLSLDPAEKTALANLKATAERVATEQDAQMAAARDPVRRDDAQANILKAGRLTEVRAMLKALAEPETAHQAALNKIEDRAYDTVLATLVIGSLISVVLATTLALWLSRSIAAPVAAMTGAMGRLAGGDNTIDIPVAGRKDEVGRMAGAVQSFKEAAIEKVRLEAEAVAQRRAVEDGQRATEAERAVAAEEQAKVVAGLATGLEKLSDGVLTYRLTDAFAPHYEKLRADFNEAMGRLQETMKVVAANTAGIRSGTGEISQAADDLSRRTEQQAASLEETAAALDQITATVRKTAGGANHARETVSAAKADAERSGAVVREAVAAMGEIETSAQKISQIIGVIDEIAFQTNLLALNAGVEAARAGDAGRGFAVVASEVRALAQRSADAAKEIKALISTSSQQVDQGVNLVGETGKALERIVAQVADLSNVVADIAVSAQEQASGLQQVNIAVNQMDQVTQQNAAMVEQSTAASHSLAGEAEGLMRLISRFEVGEASLAAAAPRPAPRPAPRFQPASAPRAGGGFAMRGNLTLKPQAGPEDESWEEF